MQAARTPLALEDRFAPATETPPDPSLIDAPAGRDVTPALEDWPHRPGELSARLVLGSDGRQKLQLRVELGLLQMEVEGRPDGGRVGRFGSQLEFRRDALERHRRAHRGDFGYGIDADAARDLDAEGQLYARRYLAWFVLGEWDRAAADARHHVVALEFLAAHAPSAAAERAVGRWLAYAVMMRARAESASLVAAGDARAALRVITSAQRRLRRFYRQRGGRLAYESAEAPACLRALARRLRERAPVTPVRRLRRELRAAVASERYEKAAALRDRIRSMGGRV